MAIRVVLYVSLLLGCLSSAKAEISFSQLIFDDCDEALKYFTAAPPGKRKTFIENLSNILSINLIPPSAPEAFATNQQLSLTPEPHIFNGGSGEQWIGLQWKNMDAQRELKAKHCALTAFETAGVDAFDQLLTLAKIYQANTLSDELSVRLEEVSFQIAESSRVAGVIPSNDLIDNMITLSISDNSLLAQNFLEEYRQEAIPILLRNFSNLARQNTEGAVRLFLHLDREEPTLTLFLELLPALDQESISTLSPLISVPSAPRNTLSLSDIIQKIDKSRQSDTLLHLIGRACLESRDGTLSKESSVVLTKLTTLWEPQRLQVDQVRCLLRRSPPLVLTLLESLERNPHGEQARYIIKLLSSPDSFSNRELSDQAYYTLQRRALDLKSSNAVHALDGLSSFERFSTENANTSIRLLQLCQSANKIGPSAKQSIQESSLRLLRNSGKGAANPLYAPTILSQLRDDSLSQTAVHLLASLPSLPDRLWWMASSPLRTSSARNALKIISKRKEPHLRLATKLIPLLSDPSESPYAAEILYALRNDIAPALKASYPLSDTLGTDSLATILSGTAEPETSHIKRAVNVLRTAPCSYSQERATILRGATLSTSPSIKHAALNHVTRCLQVYFPDTIVALAENNEAVIKALASSLNSSTNAPQTAEWISAVVMGLPITADTVEKYADLLAVLIKMSPDAMRIRLLKTLEERESIPLVILDTLSSMLNELEFGSALQTWRIVTLLARHLPNSLNLSRILEHAENQLLNENPLPIYQALSALPSTETLALIHNNLKSSDRKLLVNGSLTGAAFGSRALPIVSQLWNLRLHRDPTVRYAAVLALLSINPLTPDLRKPLENILTNRMYDMALVMPVSWSKTLAFIELDGTQFGSLRKSRMARLKEVERLRDQ